MLLMVLTMVVDQSDPTHDSASAELSNEKHPNSNLTAVFRRYSSALYLVFLFCLPGEVGKGRSE